MVKNIFKTLNIVFMEFNLIQISFTDYNGIMEDTC